MNIVSVERDTFDRDPAPLTIARKPGGYWCDVVQVDRVGKRVKLHDARRGMCYWVSFKTLAKDWRMNQP